MALLSTFLRVAPAATVALVFCAVGCASSGTLSGATGSSQVGSRALAPHAGPEHPTDLLADMPNDAIAAIHRSKCGACHTPVEPASLPRGVAESAMQRHRRRAKLTEREWANMVDYLSIDGAHARPTARVP